jgi:hypothetical protein
LILAKRRHSDTRGVWLTKEILAYRITAWLRLLGVLILGAQGVRSLSVLLVPRNSGELDQAQGGRPPSGYLE